ncbi:MAG: aspartate--tRNA(Asn) ligase [archaeon]|nr:aspartate--tRNA(Asn) ligase [archaeon]
MKRTLIKDLKNFIGSEAYLEGFIKNIREFKQFRFLFVQDRSNTSQVVLPNEVYPQRIGYEDVVGIKGLVIDQPKSKHGGLEVLAKSIDFLSRGKEGSCFNPKDEPDLNIETMLDKRASSLRLDNNQTIFLTQSIIIGSLSRYLYENGFVEVKTPKIITSALEGGANLFEVNYFGKSAYLSQSPQLYHQMLMASFERVFEIGPCFRAEDYATSRHINEFTSLDAQMGFIKDHYEIMNLLESTLSSIQDLQLNVPESIPQISYKEAIKVINKDNGIKLSGEDKRVLGDVAREKYSSDFLFIYGFPKEITNFYVMPDEEDQTRSFKLVYKGQEICTGGQRINDYNQLLNSMTQKGINPDEFKDYLEAFKCGIPPHGGFCIGLNRLTSLILGLDNVKRAVLFPRDTKRLTP